MANADAADIPATKDEILRAAAVLDLPIPDACLPGVGTNMALLRSHAEAMLGQARSAQS